jgi:hypothetical protein
MVSTRGLTLSYRHQEGSIQVYYSASLALVLSPIIRSTCQCNRPTPTSRADSLMRLRLGIPFEKRSRLKWLRANTLVPAPAHPQHQSSLRELDFNEATLTAAFEGADRLRQTRGHQVTLLASASLVAHRPSNEEVVAHFWPSLKFEDLGLVL